MKISISTEDFELYNLLEREALKNHIDIVNAKVENVLFKNLEKNKSDAYIFCNDVYFCQRAVDFIKKNNPYLPVVIINKSEKIIKNADLYNEYNNSLEFINCLFINIENYKTNFDKLVKLTTKMSDIIKFGDCIYDPTRRILYHKDNEIKKLSEKEGYIIEILSNNINNVVKREIILEKIWRKSDYFVSRTLDVYICNLRNLLKDNNINLNIKNINKVGIILE